MATLRGKLASEVTGDMPAPYSEFLYESTIHLIAGPSGAGKSHISRAMVAEFSHKRNVLYVNHEDDERLQRHAFDALGANLDSIRLDTYTLPDGLDDLYAVVQAEDIRLIVFDTAEKSILCPPQYHGRALSRLQHEVLAPTGAAALFVHHTNKSVKRNADWRSAIGGHTSGLTGSARAIALVGKAAPAADGSPGGCIFCPVKDSYGADPIGQPVSIRYTLDVEWIDQSDGRTASVAYAVAEDTGISIANPVDLVFVGGTDDPATSREPAEKRAEAGMFITTMLSAGPMARMDTFDCPSCGRFGEKACAGANPPCPDCGGPLTPVEGMESIARGRGISWGTIKRALSTVGTENLKCKFSDRSFRYYVLTADHPACIANPAIRNPLK